MSYARADDQQYEGELVRGFYDQLKSEVAGKVSDQTPPLAFFDQENLQPGDPWSQEIAQALRSCRTFVPIMSARYFTRDYCGKEWQIFEDRCRSFAGSSLPPLIIPILWNPPEEGVLPEYATSLQVTFDPRRVLEPDRAPLADYGKYGLLYLVKRKDTTHRNAFTTIVEELATRIVRVALDHPLNPLDANQLPSLRDGANRFRMAAPTAAPGAAPSNRANFTFIAGRDAEMAAIRPGAHQYYGPASEQDWMPYAIAEPEAIALIAQAAASEKRLIVNWIRPGPDLVRALEQAERDNSVALVVIDPWTVRLPAFRSLLEQFDQRQFRNCVVLIPWNKSDPETLAALDDLKDVLQRSLSRNFGGRKEIYFRPEIYDPATLRGEIARALSDLEALLAPFRTPTRVTTTGGMTEVPSLSARSTR
jgi:FxsC-like protein